MTWIDDPAFTPDAPFGPQTLPYGVTDGAAWTELRERVLTLATATSRPTLTWRRTGRTCRSRWATDRGAASSRTETPW